MSLFGETVEQTKGSMSSRLRPLADRFRPRSLEDFVGLETLLGKGKPLANALSQKALYSSLILWGPPGSGKTSLALWCAENQGLPYVQLGANEVGVKKLDEALKSLKGEAGDQGGRVALVLDEIHRFNAGQQDRLLKMVEEGLVQLFATTTENPHRRLRKALCSRCLVLSLPALKEKDLFLLLERCLQDRDRGYGALDLTVDPKVLEWLASSCNGDVRQALTWLEFLVSGASYDLEGGLEVGISQLELLRQSKTDRALSSSYQDVVSAWIKSMRGGDPDAALLWLACLLSEGVDEIYLFRRLAIFASEDVGLAQPQGISVIRSCWESFEEVGMPEGRYFLSHATLYLALAPKSNTTKSFFKAQKWLRSRTGVEVPEHLSLDPVGSKKYLYPHDFPGRFCEQEYWACDKPREIFYENHEPQGWEKQILKLRQQRSKGE